MKRLTGAVLVLATLATVAIGAGTASAEETPGQAARIFEVTVEVTNLAPEGGTFQTPVWLGSQDGSFDLYDRDAAISPELERLAEDGSTGPITELFAASGAGTDAVAFGPNGPIFPGETASVSFLVDTTRGENQYLSYASMVIPSNDAFIANGDPMAHKIFNDRGRFMPVSFTVAGSEVLDAGSEVNDEIPENTAALAQAAPDTGETEGGVVTLHEGFQAEGNVLAAIPNGDFTADGYETLRFEVSAKRMNSRAAAALHGYLEVPAVSTQGRGTVRLLLTADGDIEWRINASRIDNVIAAHIHLAGPGMNGSVAIPLDLGSPSGNNFLAFGEVGDDDVVLEGMTILDVWHEIQAGRAYINVHTSDHPGGELRANLP